MTKSKVQFKSKIQNIFKKEGIVEFDEKLLEERLVDDRKSSVVSIVKLMDGRTVFFKAIKPWSDAHKIIDNQKGIVISEIMKKVGASGYPEIISSGEYEGVYYIIEEVLKIVDTLSDEKIKLLSAVDAQNIVNLYQSNRKKLSNFLTKNPIEAKSLFPYGTIAPSFGFLGMILLFEARLRPDFIGAPARQGEGLVKEILDKHKSEFFDSSRLFLLHGDFAPHNIILGESIYFVDWERGFAIFNPFVGESYDLANLYIAAFQNPQAQKIIYQNSLSFKLCLMFHLLSKMNNIVMFGDPEKHQAELEWMKLEYHRI